MAMAIHTIGSICHVILQISSKEKCTLMENKVMSHINRNKVQTDNKDN